MNYYRFPESRAGSSTQQGLEWVHSVYWSLLKILFFFLNVISKYVIFLFFPCFSLGLFCFLCLLVFVIKKVSCDLYIFIYKQGLGKYPIHVSSLSLRKLGRLVLRYTRM